MCVNIIHKWRGPPTPNERFFEKLFMTILRAMENRKSPKKYFSYFVLMSILGLEPWLFVFSSESVCEAPSISIHHRSQQLNISETSLRRILHKDLGMTPYKVQFGYRSYSQLTIQCVFASLSGPAIDLQNMPILAKKIIFSDEAHFDLDE